MAPSVSAARDDFLLDTKTSRFFRTPGRPFKPARCLCKVGNGYRWDRHFAPTSPVCNQVLNRPDNKWDFRCSPATWTLRTGQKSQASKPLIAGVAKTARVRLRRPAAVVPCRGEGLHEVSPTGVYLYLNLTTQLHDGVIRQVQEVRRRPRIAMHLRKKLLTPLRHAVTRR